MTMSAGGSLDLYFLNLCIFVNKQIIYALLLQNMSPRFSQFFKGKKPNPLILDLVGVYVYSGWMGILRKCTKLDIWIFRYFDIKLGSNWDGEDEDLGLFGVSGRQWKLLRNW